MAVKTITIKEDVYLLLTSIKRNDESFSDLFERLVKSTDNIAHLKELRGSVRFKDKEALLRDIYGARRERRY